MSASCLSCQHYVTCAIPGKGRNFICGTYRERPIDDRLLLGGLGFGAQESDLQDAQAAQRQQEMESKELDLEKIVDEIIASKAVVPRDFRIDDSDLPDFKNIYDYVFNDKYPLDIALWMRQMWIGIKLFADWCPRCSHPDLKITIPHPDYDPIEHIIPVNGEGKDILEWVQVLDRGVCPKCQATRSEMVMSGELNFYNELAAVVGQRSGKSTITAIFDSYLTARYLKLQKPTSVYPGVARNTTLMGTMVALRFQDANDLLWTPYKDTLNGSSWFQEYHKLMKHYNNKYDQELFKELDTYIKYGHRNLHIYPSGPNKRTLRGRTRIFANIDEFGWFDSNSDSDSKERTSASEVYNALDASLKTIRVASEILLKRGYNDIPNAYAMNVSSPSSEDDEIMTLVKNSKHSRTVFAVHLPTWSVNPNLTRESLQPDYDKNFSFATRNFGAVPPESSNPFFGQGDPLLEAFNKFPNGVLYKPTIGYDPEGRKKCAVELTQISQSHIKHVLTMDAGQTKNSFSLAVARIDPTLPINQGRIQFPVLIECQPQKDAAISFTQMKIQVISKLIIAYNVVGVFADRWQSIMMLDDLSEEFKQRQLYTQVYSVKYRDFVDFKSYVVGGGCWFPTIENENPHMADMSNYPGYFEGSPAHHLFFQCKRSVDRGIVVEKGPKVTDDLLRAAVLATAWLLNEKWASKNLQGTAPVAGAASAGGYAGRTSGMSMGQQQSSPLGSNRGQGERRSMVIGRSSRGSGFR